MLALEFASGKLNLYNLVTTQLTTGGMPKQTLSYVGWTYYGDKTISFSRRYEARGADAPCDRVVRVPIDVNVEVGMYVILEDSQQYRIDALSPIIVATNYRATELTLARVEALYDVASN